MKLMPMWLRWNLMNSGMNIKIWIVDRLPEWIIYYSLVRAGINASTGKYSNQVVTELTLIDVMKRWEVSNK